MQQIDGVKLIFRLCAVKIAVVPIKLNFDPYLGMFYTKVMANDVLPISADQQITDVHKISRERRTEMEVITGKRPIDAVVASSNKTCVNENCDCPAPKV